jgi:alkylated DNA repair protein (DNA oxidative demethylase)
LEIYDGLFYIPNFITPKEEKALLTHIKQIKWQEVALFGKIAKRRVVHYGMDYNFDRRIVTPTIPQPPFLKRVIHRSADWLKIPKQELAEVLIS